MTRPVGLEADAAWLRDAVVKDLTEDSLMGGTGWLVAVETVLRHWFVPGFYLLASERYRQAGATPAGGPWLMPV